MSTRAIYSGTDDGSASAGAARGSLGRWLWMRRRRVAALVVTPAVICGVLAPLVVSLVPPTYQATAQLVIDPRGLQVFAGEQDGVISDANAGINFVETQLQLLTSERVLSRVLREQAGAPEQTQGGDPGPDIGLRPGFGVDQASADPKAIAALRRNLVVKRGERSFLVDITAKAASSERAASLANGVMKAFIEEDSASRAQAGRRLNAEIGGRLADVRRQLAASENAADAFRVKNGLVTSSGEQLVSEQRLEQAVTAVGDAELRVARSEARVKQLDDAKLDLGALGPLTATDDMRTISYLIERLSAAREALADARMNLGPRHPALVSAQSRVNEINSRIQADLSRIKAAARTDLERARNERDAIRAEMATLSGAVQKDRKSGVELKTLEEQVAANRKLLATFEGRAREADEFSRVTPANIRVASVATPDEGRSRLLTMIAAAIAGGLFGGLLGVAAVAFWAVFSLGRSPGLRRPRAADGPPRDLARAG